ncbi:hypothetical protein JTB14_030522 [Gonioctena quinquepunctata]|nr:hypothetical protein JTB14_030522 [Gonioctena quinquepunctata]
MPRAKKPKRLDARNHKNYDSERMQKAIEDCQNGGSYLSVAKRYAINRTTLMNHVEGYKCKKVGRPTVLTHEEEEMLVQSLVELGKWGYGFDRLQLQRCVQEYVRRLDRPNPFQNVLRDLDWCQLFENRWKARTSRRAVPKHCA